MTTSISAAAPVAPPQAAAFATVTTLFFTWGFITSVIDPLIPSVRAIFHLGYAQSMLTQFAFFLAYGVVSLPAAAIVARLGYGRAIIVALAVMTCGCLLISLATILDTYAIVLAALFVIAGGITILQVAANPLAVGLGAPDRAHFRLTLSQAFNSLGTVIGPYFGAMLMLRGGVFKVGGATTAAQRSQSFAGINNSFLVVAGLILALALFIMAQRRRIEAAAPASSGLEGANVMAALKSKWAMLGALAIFLYVGAEVSIGSLMINFLHQKDILGIGLEGAGKLVALYWLGAMVGRFAGSALLARFKAFHLLAIAALTAALQCLAVALLSGPWAAGVVISIGLGNAIMFPTIFSLTLERTSASSAQTSGLLCMAIVGGAVLPLVVGLIADAAGLHAAYLVPMIAYAFICGFAILAGRARIMHAAAPVMGGH